MSDGPLQSLVNGQQAEHISIRDRGFLYGDGCFETVRLIAGKAILLPEHLERLRSACALLNLPIDFALLQREISELLDSITSYSAVLKIIITRGEGGRGYAPQNGADCTRVIQLFDYNQPQMTGARAVVCEHRLSTNAGLAGVKHLNRLDQVLASAQIPEGFHEGLCLDQDGLVVEGCRSNLLLALDETLLSPDLSNCGVEGIMLNYMIKELAQQGHPVVRTAVTPDALSSASEVYLCNSVFGVWPVSELRMPDKVLSWSPAEGRHGEAIGTVVNELFGKAVSISND